MNMFAGRMTYEAFCTLRCVGWGRDDLRRKSDGQVADFSEFAADLGDAMHNVWEMGVHQSDDFILKSIAAFLRKYPRCVEVMSFSASHVGQELKIDDFASELRHMFADMAS